MTLDWLRLWPELLRLNLLKSRHRLNLRRAAGNAHRRAAPCQSASDSGRPLETRCEACHRFDRASRYRAVCPDLVLVPGDARCGRDASAVRPYWGRALAQFGALLLVVYLGLGLSAWALLRTRGMGKLSPVEVLLPSRWPDIAEHRRAHFQLVALRAIAANDAVTASVALFTAAQTGHGTADSNVALARLSTLGGYHSLADELHASNIAAHPQRANELAAAWHDDLLLSGRPQELARLALKRLALPEAPREFWLRAFFESIRHRGVSGALLASPSADALPHPGLRFALLARDALDRDDHAAAVDQLLAFAGALPGESARRFLVFSWLDAAEPERARAAALSTAHPSPPGEIAALAHALLRDAGNIDAARATLRPLLARPALRPLVLAALIRDPDADLVAELAAAPAAESGVAPRFPVGLWIAARRAGDRALAARLAEDLARNGQPLPPELGGDPAAPAPREKLVLAAGLFPLDREVIYALREAR